AAPASGAGAAAASPRQAPPPRPRPPASAARGAGAGGPRPAAPAPRPANPRPADPPRGSFTNASRTHRGARPAAELERPDQDTKERTIMSGNQTPPQPPSALRRLDRLAGTCTLAGNLAGSDANNITSQTP